MCIEGRQTGWLSETLHCQFREILTHASFRYALVCPVYCLMPDHFHLMWMGIDTGSDQINATRFLRKELGRLLGASGFSLQTSATITYFVKTNVWKVRS